MEITAELVRARKIHSQVTSLCNRLQEALRSELRHGVELPPSPWRRDCNVLVYWVLAVGGSTARDEEARGVLRGARTTVSALFSSLKEAKPRVNLERHKHVVIRLMSAFDEILCDAQGVYVL